MKISRVKFKDIEQIPKLRVNTNFKQQFMGSAPAPFIGRFGYPNVNIGVLSPQFSGDMSQYDSPRLWSQENTQIGEIASKRYGLVNSRTKWNIKDINSQLSSNKTSAEFFGKNNVQRTRFLDVCQEASMVKTAVEIEVSLKKMPRLAVKAEKEVIPFGPGSELQKARSVGNVRIDTRMEKIVYDTDLKAARGIVNLYKKGFEDNNLSKLLSVGTLGVKKNRTLVPTRWSITATDDTIGKELIKEIKDYSVGECLVYFGGEWGNYYLLLFFPEVWSFELFETYLALQTNPWSKKGYAYSTDYEGYTGRKNYAEETAGGYYACRIGVLEKLKELRKQGSVLALRFITDEYKIPLGVWICREATRKSLQNKPIRFSSEELMMRYVKLFVKKQFNFDVELLLKESKLLKTKKAQAKLGEF